MTHACVQTRIVDREREVVVHRQIVAVMDVLENRCLPDVRVSTMHVEFGEVRFGRALTRTLEMVNTGQVVARFELAPKPEQSNYCKLWLAVVPQHGVIPVGGRLTLTIALCVDVHSSSALNAGAEDLDDILIVRLAHGKDLFVSVVGDYRRTCFGTRLDHLVMMPRPVRTLEGPVAVPDGTDVADVPLNIPKELWWLVDWLCGHANEACGIFGRRYEDWDLVDRVQECLDLGYALEDGTPCVICSIASLFAPLPARVSLNVPTSGACAQDWSLLLWARPCCGC